MVPRYFLPLGISFFTLTQIMYLVDTYERAVSPGSLFDHATFISFFPYILSGPLAKAKRMRRQLTGIPPSAEKGASLARGLYLLSLGLFKKSVCAEAFAQVATYGFDTARHRSMLEVAVYSICYSMQIYFDFSGYSDMAIGSAEMLGIEIPRNFDAPFRAKSLIEFWERWHISLSSFIATYMYTPLLRSFRKADTGGRHAFNLRRHVTCGLMARTRVDVCSLRHDARSSAGNRFILAQAYQDEAADLALMESDVWHRQSCFYAVPLLYSSLCSGNVARIGGC